MASYRERVRRIERIERELESPEEKREKERVKAFLESLSEEEFYVIGEFLQRSDAGETFDDLTEEEVRILAKF